ncbi:hypothetical protein [Marinovum sp. B10]|jgi:hypothetical protein|uniref:Uncharacterized protein n=1 Tax=Marinovum algicola TaxID=42444 RepID=A0A975W7F0_9RHOB|nr:hypothetical protein MALG_01331 [Marinovum algicola DG 898]SEI84179.1 hypothetical protein SAMN04487940_102171 [Marinovum algicola]SLN15614.1 hypothetical protein MAA5396_00343 [Marinovum algicola]
MRMVLVAVQAAILLMLAVIGAQGDDSQRASCPVNQPGAYCER